MLKSIHHIAIICSDYEKSKAFYVHKLGFQVIQETYREERGSYKLDLSLNGSYAIELFSFPTRPNAKPGLKPQACVTSPLQSAAWMRRFRRFMKKELKQSQSEKIR